jgi:hypothetical protein
MSSDDFGTFLDYKAIIELKARFGRLVDVQNWEAWADLFTEDCVFDLGAGECMIGGRDFAQANKGWLEGNVSVHRAYMPEIEFISADEARGIWAVNDYVEYSPDPETGSRSGQMGYGREYETYRKLGGKWKIAHWRLRYDRIDPLAREPLPTTFLGGPDLMRDEDYLMSVVNPRGS